jgi:hypothetical protein
MVEYVRVGSFASRSLAELAVTFLNANGIEATVVADDAGGQYPATLSGRGIWLRVPAEDADAARELFAQADAAQAADADAASRAAAAPDAGLKPLGPPAPAVWAVRLAVAAVVALVVAAALPRLS